MSRMVDDMRRDRVRAPIAKPSLARLRSLIACHRSSKINVRPNLRSVCWLIAKIWQNGSQVSSDCAQRAFGQLRAGDALKDVLGLFQKEITESTFIPEIGRVSVTW